MLKLEPNQDCKCSSISLSKLSTQQLLDIKKASVKGQIQLQLCCKASNVSFSHLKIKFLNCSTEYLKNATYTELQNLDLIEEATETLRP